VFARRSFVTFVDVNVALGTDISTWTATSVAPIDDTRLANGASIARIGSTSVVQMAKQPGLVGWAFAFISGNAVMTSASVQAGLCHTVVHVNFAIVAFVSIDTDARVASLGVVTSGSILANVRPDKAFVDVFGAVSSGEFRRAIASVASDAVQAAAAILAEVAVAIVFVDVAAGTGEASRTRAGVIVAVDFTTITTILAGVRGTRVVNIFTMFARVALLAHALVRSVRVCANASVPARIFQALVHVHLAVWPLEAVMALASMRVSRADTNAIVATRLVSAVIDLVAMIALPAHGTSTGIIGQGLEAASAPVLTWAVGTGVVGHGDLAERGRVADGAGALEGRAPGRGHDH